MLQVTDKKIMTVCWDSPPGIPASLSSPASRLGDLLNAL
jgi:hypothetical protein